MTKNAKRVKYNGKEYSVEEFANLAGVKPRSVYDCFSRKRYQIKGYRFTVIGTGVHANCKPVICVETGKVYKSVMKAADDILVCRQAISNALHGKTQTAGGYHWKFA